LHRDISKDEKKLKKTKKPRQHIIKELKINKKIQELKTIFKKV